MQSATISCQITESVSVSRTTPPLSLSQLSTVLFPSSGNQHVPSVLYPRQVPVLQDALTEDQALLHVEING